MIAVLYATEKEARPLLDRVHAVPVEDAACALFSGRVANRPLLIAISGMGMPAAEAACRHLVQTHQVDTILNVGICAGLAGNMPVGALYTAGEAVVADACQADDPSAPVGVPLTAWPGLPRKRLGSVSEPLFDAARREAIAAQCELVDMEGAAVARACRELGVTCRLLKGVSDDARPGSRDTLLEHLEPVSRRLAGQVIQDLPELFPPQEHRGGLLARLAGFTRLEHTVFSLPLLFAGAWLGADGRLPAWGTVLLIVLVGTGARTFGMAVNRILDRDIDACNPRTAGRELPSGRLTLLRAYLVACAGLAAYLTGCAALGRLCVILSPVPLIPLTLYTLLKRFTLLCHFGIGVCLATAPLGAFVATSGQLPAGVEIWMLASFTFLWISGFDIIYAIQDIEPDRRSGVRSIPAACGANASLYVAAAVHSVAVVLLYGLWLRSGHGMAAGVAMMISGSTFAVAYHPRIPIAVRFFPLSVVAGSAAAAVVLLRSAI